jgi:hypothetical protein
MRAISASSSLTARIAPVKAQGYGPRRRSFAERDKLQSLARQFPCEAVLFIGRMLDTSRLAKCNRLK